MEDGSVIEAEHDLVILATGLISDPSIKDVFKNVDLQLDPYRFVNPVNENINPVLTNVKGVLLLDVLQDQRIFQIQLLKLMLQLLNAWIIYMRWEQRLLR